MKAFILLAIIQAGGCGQGTEPEAPPEPAKSAPGPFLCMPQRLFCLDSKVWRCRDYADAWVWETCTNGCSRECADGAEACCK